MSEFRYEGCKSQGMGPMQTVFFFSGGASGMKAVLESPDHGSVYRVSGAVTNKPKAEAAKGYDVARQFGVPVVFVDPKGKHISGRDDFYKAVGELIGLEEADVIGLSGWLGKYSLMPDGFVNGPYKNRIINVHPADLSIVENINGSCSISGYTTSRIHPIDVGRLVKCRARSLRDKPHEEAKNFLSISKSKRLYTGDDAVAMAVLLGESEVCSTIHSVTAECDGGPILVQSKRLPVDKGFVDKMLARNAFGRMVDYAHDLQGQMKVECDGPAFCEALRLLGEGRLEIGDDFATLDGEMLPYGGYQMEKLEV